MSILEVDSLHVTFHTRAGAVRAVDGISFSLDAGETVAIVGESGSGKTMTAYALLGLVPAPTGVVSAERVHFDGSNLLGLPPKSLRKIRGKRISMIFQDPMTALNPYMTVGRQIAEVLELHEGCSRREAMSRAAEALGEVGIPEPERRLRQYPHEFSGGMRQRAMVAMALAPRPDILIADEPTTALDVTVQAQMLELIQRLQRERGMAMLLITHDLGIVAGICDRVLVMYAGRILESAPTDSLFKAPKHPYTRALLASLPAAHRHGERLYAIPGAPPDLIQPVAGCPFAPRCEFALAKCLEPMSLMALSESRATACIRAEEELW